jgi:uncharacterized MAPEG superfamily protein
MGASGGGAYSVALASGASWCSLGHIGQRFIDGDQMTIAEWCLLGAVLLYLLTLAPIKPMARGEFDNARPRDPAFYETPLRARVLGAHLNGIETFPFFAAAVLLAEFRHAPQLRIDALAAGFIVARLAFVAAYLANWPTARSVIWNVGFLFNLAIFLLPIWA